MMALQQRFLLVATAYGVSTRNRFISHPAPTGKLAVILPGRDFSCDRPALFYLRQIALAAGYDVLCLQYGFQVTGSDPAPAETDQQARAEASDALGQAMALRRYSEVCFIGKSMGTQVALALAAEKVAEQQAAILLTPVWLGLGPYDGLRTLAVIGTADPAYGGPEYDAARERNDADWVGLEGVGHNLEHGAGWSHSLAALQQVLREAESFLRS